MKRSTGIWGICFVAGCLAAPQDSFDRTQSAVMDADSLQTLLSEHGVDSTLIAADATGTSFTLSDAQVEAVFAHTIFASPLDAPEVVGADPQNGCAGRVASQTFELMTIGGTADVSLTCTHLGCTDAANCEVTGCDPLASGAGCSSPQCTGVNCEGAPLGCQKSRTIRFPSAEEVEPEPGPGR